MWPSGDKVSPVIQLLHLDELPVASDENDLSSLSEFWKTLLKNRSRTVCVICWHCYLSLCLLCQYDDLTKKRRIVLNDKAKIAAVIAELDEKKNEALKKAHQQVNKVSVGYCIHAVGEVHNNETTFQEVYLIRCSIQCRRKNSRNVYSALRTCCVVKTLNFN